MSETELRAIDVEIAKTFGADVYKFEQGYLLMSLDNIFYVSRHEETGEFKYSGYYSSTIEEAWEHCLPYSSDMSCAVLVEARIAELGLQERYVEELVNECCHEVEITKDKFIGSISPNVLYWPAHNAKLLWRIVTATPLQRCRAALKAVEGSKGNG